MAKNQIKGTVGLFQKTRVYQVEEATTKGGRELARVGYARWHGHGRATQAQGNRDTKHGRAGFPVQPWVSWRLGFAYWDTIFVAGRVLLYELNPRFLDSI